MKKCIFSAIGVFAVLAMAILISSPLYHSQADASNLSTNLTSYDFVINALLVGDESVEIIVYGYAIDNEQLEDISPEEPFYTFDWQTRTEILGAIVDLENGNIQYAVLNEDGTLSELGFSRDDLYLFSGQDFSADSS